MDQPSSTQSASAGDPVRIALRLGLLIGMIYWSYILVLPFIPILVWSAILAVALYPLFDLLAGLLGGRRGAAAILITILGLGIVIGPASWLIFGLVEGMRSISDQLGTGNVFVPTPNKAVKQWPLIGDRLFEFWQLASTNLAAALGKFSPYAKPMATAILSILGGVGMEIMKFLVAVILTGFLFVPGPRLVSNMRTFLRHIVPERSEEFVTLAGATIRSVSRGVIGIALLQSFLAGVGFIIADISGAGLFAFLVLLLGAAQVGCAILLLPMIAWYWMTREPTAAFLFTLYIVPVGLIDNVLKPLVIGHGSQTPMVIIFIGVLGGTLAHGLIGLFVGPIVLAVGWELLAAWMRDETSHNAPTREDAAKHAPPSNVRSRTLLP